MKNPLLTIIISILCTQAFAIDTKADSLAQLYASARTQHQRVVNCLNLDNYYRNYLRIDSLPLAYTLLHEAVKDRNDYATADALRKLVMQVDRKERVLTNDSVARYLGLADKYLKGERLRSFVTEVRLRHIRSKVDWAQSESKIIAELTARYSNPNEHKDDIYFQIERNYALAMSAAMGISNIHVDAYRNTLRYYDRLVELTCSLPVQYGAEILFWVNENIYIGYINARQNEQAVAFLEKMMNVLTEYKKLPYVKDDVYQTFEYTYSLYNEGLARFPSIVGRKKSQEHLALADKMMRERGDLSWLYFTYKGYYEDLKDYKNIILYADSIVRFMTTYDAAASDAVISSMYKDQAACYAALNDYRKAYELMHQHQTLQEKITDSESQNLIADMDARYDLNRLELEKEQLASRNRLIAIFSILFVFLLSVAWGFTQWRSVKRLKAIQRKLIESNDEVVRQSEKAQESEKMKTSLINSICHEIRTPLNAINGFSGLLLDPTLDDETKKEFPELIKESTTLLTILINNMLEVANLSSSQEDLPVEQTDLLEICTRRMQLLTHTEKKECIDYRLDIADDCRCILTNEFYLSQAIAHLLDNANKFTSSGTITLACRTNSLGRIEIKVTDTGIGIPADKRQWVFERFAKLDDFKQGTGL